MQLYKVIYYILFIPLGLYSLYFLLTGLFCFKKEKKKLEIFLPRNKFAVVIPARNESAVIAGLIDSLMQQHYPKDLYDVYTVPNNCSDNTEETARNAGARIIRIYGQSKTKGDVLKQAFDYLLQYYNYDAYIIFDADNLVHPEFLSRMNDALCSGYEVAQGFRDSKNPFKSWISGNTSIYYWFLNIFFNRARRNIGKSAAINGTGFMIKESLLRSIGYNVSTLTEDIEFTMQCALNGSNILFVEDAVVYDEQPEDIYTSLKQRKRWSAGQYQCLFKYHGELLKQAFIKKNFSCADMLLVSYAPIVQVVCFFISLILFVYNLGGLKIYNLSVFFFTYYEFYSFVVTYLLQVSIAVLTVLLVHKSVRNTLKSVLMFPVFWLTWLPLNIACLFRHDIEWEPIRHTKAIDINAVLAQRELK